MALLQGLTTLLKRVIGPDNALFSPQPEVSQRDRPVSPMPASIVGGTKEKDRGEPSSLTGGR